MFTFNVNLGQIIICLLVTIIGYFIKRTIENLEGRVGKVETSTHSLDIAVAQLLAIFGNRHTDKDSIKELIS